MYNHVYQLIPYSSQINNFCTEDAITILHASFLLSDSEKEKIKDLLENLYRPLSEMNWTQRKEAGIKELREKCTQDFQSYILGQISEVSDIHKRLFVEIDRNPNRKRNLNLVHSIARLGEFFYMTDQEMERISQDMDSFIESGECGLFDYETSPYSDKPLTKSFQRDLYKFEDDIREYLKNHELPDITTSEVQSALKKIRGYIDGSDLSKVPKGFRGLIQVCKEIRREVVRETKARDWNHPGNQGILPGDIMKKLSGFCLNKEEVFKNFLFKTGMPSWKNPEGSWLYGVSKYPWNPNYFQEMKFCPWWDMDVIYYSLGKGPWDKSRYVGQPCSFYQNVAEPLASTVKKVIKQHHKRYKRKVRGVYNAECINIYENYDSLLETVSGMKDSLAMDFDSYSDYLSRNSFEWVLKYMWGVPKAYRDEILFLMGLPIKVNGRVYPHLHGSVMGIKVNFLLITFSNALMWMVGCELSHCYDIAKFMGDDRIQVNKKRTYSQKEVDIQHAVTAFFNCKINTLKSEWLSVDGHTSFCKRTFDINGDQISGFSGEYVLKQKPFMNDLSVWLNVCKNNQIPVNQKQVEVWLEHFSGYYPVTYFKFSSVGDPSVEEMASILSKIPYRYGGWSLEEPDDMMDKIMFQSILSTVNAMMLESQSETSFDSGREKIRNYIKRFSEEGNRYLEAARNSTSYSYDWDELMRCIQDIHLILESRVIKSEMLERARKSARRILEIVLERDSRLASSVSTKNRIDYTFDQDRVAKLRFKYFQASLKEEGERIYSGLYDTLILESFKDLGIQGAVKEYFRYKELCSETGCYLFSYNDAVGHIYTAMRVFRRNPRGELVSLVTRLTSSDNYYDHYRIFGDGTTEGNFLVYSDLTSKEQELRTLLKRKEVREAIDHLDKTMNSALDSAISYLISYLADLYPEVKESFKA